MRFRLPLRRWPGTISMTAALVLVLAVSGCGQNSSQPSNTGSQPATTSAGKADAAGNPPFHNYLKSEVGALDAKYDPQPASASTYTQVQAVNANGQKVTLNAKEHPIIFVAYWCPHCQRTLVMFTQKEKQLHQLPIIVSMGFQPGTTLAEAKKLTAAEHSTLGLSNNFKIYYGLYNKKVSYVPVGYPTLAYYDGQKLQTLFGEHTFSIWQKALAMAK